LAASSWLALNHGHACHAVTSVGSKGDSYDNALAESVNGLYKTELIRAQGPWRTADQVELATAAWVAWWNRDRVHAPSLGRGSGQRGLLTRPFGRPVSRRAFPFPPPSSLTSLGRRPASAGGLERVGSLIERASRGGMTEEDAFELGTALVEDEQSPRADR
jgi:hypothetical protein